MTPDNTMLNEAAIAAEPMDEARRAMIDSQLRVSGVNDPAVLAAIAAVSRENYLPGPAKASAYIDRAVPLADGHALPAPLVHGRLLSEAQITPADIVLVVSPSGYLEAVIRAFGCAVSTIAPADAAKSRGKAGSVSLIIVDGAIEQLPAGLAGQLAEGGRVVTGTVERGVTRLAVGKRVGGEVALLPLAEIGMPVLPEFARPKGWSF